MEFSGFKFIRLLFVGTCEGNCICGENLREGIDDACSGKHCNTYIDLQFNPVLNNLNHISKRQQIFGNQKFL